MNNSSASFSFLRTQKKKGSFFPWQEKEDDRSLVILIFRLSLSLSLSLTLSLSHSLVSLPREKTNRERRRSRKLKKEEEYIFCARLSLSWSGYRVTHLYQSSSSNWYWHAAKTCLCTKEAVMYGEIESPFFPPFSVMALASLAGSVCVY